MAGLRLCASFRFLLTEDLVDDAVAWLNRQQSIAPDKPYFMYFAPGAASYAVL